MPRVKKIIQARDGGPIPVAYAEVEVGGETVLAPVVVLEAGAQVQLSGSTLAEQLTDADASEGVLTFSANLEYVEIYNRDAVNDGVFTVNGIDITVPAGEVWSGRVGGTAAATVTVATSTSYIVSRYI